VSAIGRIPVKVVAATDLATGNVRALLHEIAGLLETWLSDGEASSIDLRSLPLTRGDYDELSVALGTGAVSANVEAIGVSEVRETRYPGVWRVTHHNEAGEVVADLIEVCEVPAILLAPEEDAGNGLIRLREALQS